MIRSIDTTTTTTTTTTANHNNNNINNNDIKPGTQAVAYIARLSKRLPTQVIYYTTTVNLYYAILD